MIVYKCAHCGADAVVRNGVVVRTCAHDGATITASLTATVTGESRVASDKK